MFGSGRFSRRTTLREAERRAERAEVDVLPEELREYQRVLVTNMADVENLLRAELGGKNG